MTNKTKLTLFHDKAVGAMLGASYGDALGWPSERNHNLSSRNSSANPKLKTWVKKCGGRYSPFEDEIQAGEYSDDTQLILAMSRALLKEDDWYEFWTNVELPFWLTYERGGGGATKRAAQSWLKGKSPWLQARNDQAKYFNAGGNGVAMRILPHIIKMRDNNSFAPIASQIFTDAITTHGHPRAIIGALAYGYALWIMSRTEITLEYGKIVKDMIAMHEEWSSFLIFSESNPEWVAAANQSLPKFSALWDETQKEMLNYLQKALAELNKEALAVDDKALGELDVFNKKINGAGTVAAASSIYLASRYASDPIHGVVKAAFAFGADTDTIASMVGGLLGCIGGTAWLNPHSETIQDANYIKHIAQQLVDAPSQIALPITRIQKKDIVAFESEYLKESVDDKTTITLCDGRHGTIQTKPDYVAKSGKYCIKLRKIVCDDGQSLYFTKIVRTNTTASSVPHQNLRCTAAGVKIISKSIQQATQLYSEFLGMQLRSKTEKIASFAEGLAIIPTDQSPFPKNKQYSAIIYVEVDNIKECFNRIKKCGLEIISSVAPFGSNSQRETFTFYDYDDNVVEVFSQESK